jgi:hypothetical protein
MFGHKRSIAQHSGVRTRIIVELSNAVAESEHWKVPKTPHKDISSKCLQRDSGPDLSVEARYHKS